MQPHRMAEWLREEHQKVDELMTALRDKASIVPRTNIASWIAEVRESFEHFRAHLNKHMALEEHEGYMKTVVQRRPALADAIARLRHEHGEITKIMDGLRQSLEQVGPEDRLLVRDCCRRIESLLQFVEHHEADENLMMLSAFTNDIGTKD